MLHARWALVLTVAALSAALAPSLLWGLVVLALILGAATVVSPRGVGRRIFPVAVLAVALAAVDWIRLRGVPGL